MFLERYDRYELDIHVSDFENCLFFICSFYAKVNYAFLAEKQWQNFHNQTLFKTENNVIFYDTFTSDNEN